MDSPIFCAACVHLYPADDFDFFELFGLPRTYDLDAAELRRAYLNLARSIHPDRIASASPEAARMSMRLSAQLNQAFEVLSDPVRRAEYLLELAGGRSAAEDKSVPPHVLEESLELREALEEARAAADEPSLLALRSAIERRHAEHLSRVQELARAMPNGETERTALRAELNALRYYQRMLEPC
jgi:molecular chaperone HscB